MELCPFVSLDLSMYAYKSSYTSVGALINPPVGTAKAKRNWKKLLNQPALIHVRQESKRLCLHMLLCLGLFPLPVSGPGGQTVEC